ncbi:MAG: hypothetical protein M0042_06210 [Nitrospiraceae bacterium]|nr:hypothetical protein [Nitrospiraceae bacterium]
MPEKFNPRLRAAFLEAVDKQLRDNDPPETRVTLERLKHEGLSEQKAKELIAAVIAAETFYILKEKQTFNHDRFVKNLNKLPDLPT